MSEDTRLSEQEALNRVKQWRRQQGWGAVSVRSKHVGEHTYEFIFGRLRGPQQAIMFACDGSSIELLWQRSR